MSTVLDGLKNAFLMAYEVWWALVLGFAISAIVQAWVPRERIEAALSGAASARSPRRPGSAPPRPPAPTRRSRSPSRCSRRAPRRSTALAFQFASTNLVWELGLVLWVLIGWQFTLAEYVGGIVMIVLMARAAAPLRLAAAGGAGAREHAQRGRRPATSTTPPARSG